MGASSTGIALFSSYFFASTPGVYPVFVFYTKKSAYCLGYKNDPEKTKLLPGGGENFPPSDLKFWKLAKFANLL